MLTHQVRKPQHQAYQRKRQIGGEKLSRKSISVEGPHHKETDPQLYMTTHASKYIYLDQAGQSDTTVVKNM